MVHLILASHGPLASAMLESVAMLCGNVQHVKAVCLYSEDSVASFHEKLLLAVPEQEDSILLVDIPGGTPSNQGMALLETHPNLRVLAGMNLMMLIEGVLRMEHTNLDELVEVLVASGKECVHEMKFTQATVDELDALLE